ncbi:catalase [Rhizobium leguminosarum]|uniref:catalase n=1 Tax=Rhizobium leguminosarum TaxID=384 RepID=UPI001FE0DFFE|nr:catalase [Rhizobium leguminosarum]
MTETASPDIDAGIAEIDELQRLLMRSTGPGLRGQHYKQHGCVFATFEVLADLPERLKIGVFAKPKAYTAYIRFSNGAQLDDTKPDIHGMAIKLTGVAGRKILEGEEDAATHDFVLADKPVFFIRNTSDYVRFMADFAQSAPRGEPPLAFIAWLKENRPEDLPVLLGFRQQVQDSPLAARYWSQVPYAYGLDDAQVCRYSVVPTKENLVSPIPSEARGAGYLREAMIGHITRAARPAVFDFCVQLNDDTSASTINNPTVEWTTPVEPVARITIPPQTFTSTAQLAFGENLSFTPWHAMPEHRPLGEINEVRRRVYLSSSGLRHETNQVVRREPTGNEHWSFNMRLSPEELTAGINADFKAVLAKLQATFNFMAANLQHGRATHTYGVVAKGEARCITPAGFPETDVFVPGRVFPIILRHSSPGGRADDRARDGVAASIKFFAPGASTDGDGFYDILMNAGRQLFVRSIRDFSTFVHTPDDDRIKLVESGLMLDDQLREAYRIRGSFTDSQYHTWVCFQFTDKTGVSRYVRFRLINADRGPDRGLPRPEFRADGHPSMDATPDDDRAPDFLRKDFIHRVRHSDVRYILQAQLRDAPPPPIGNHELFDPSQPWNEYWFPWADMFEIRLTEVMDDQAAVSRLELNPNRSPECIRIPLATSPDDYASLGHARAIVYPGARAARAAVPSPQNN